MGRGIYREKLLHQLFGQSAVVKQTNKKKSRSEFSGGEKMKMRKCRSTLRYNKSRRCGGQPLPKQVAVDSVSISPGRKPKWLKCYMWLMDTVLLLGAGGK